MTNWQIVKSGGTVPKIAFIYDSTYKFGEFTKPLSIIQWRSYRTQYKIWDSWLEFIIGKGYTLKRAKERDLPGLVRSILRTKLLPTTSGCFIFLKSMCGNMQRLLPSRRALTKIWATGLLLQFHYTGLIDDLLPMLIDTMWLKALTLNHMTGLFSMAGHFLRLSGMTSITIRSCLKQNNPFKSDRDYLPEM